MSAIDELIRLGAGDVRSLDCVLRTKVSLPLDRNKLLTGASHAQSIYPKTKSIEVSIKESSDFEAFARTPLPSEKHIEEIFWQENGENYLGFKMNHLVGDGTSIFLWLHAQLTGSSATSEIKLRHYPPKKDTLYRSLRTSTRWPANRAAISSERKFATLKLHHSLHHVNEKLTLALFKALKVERPALWIPVNAREKAWEGFGNGLSRMRLYPPPSQLSLAEQISYLKAQKKAALTSGEVALPPSTLDISRPLTKVLLHLWLKRPWADWASLSFSHMEDRGFPYLSPFSEITGITNISPQHSAALYALTRAETTWATLSYDANQVSDHQADQLLKDWKEEMIKLES